MSDRDPQRRRFLRSACRHCLGLGLTGWGVAAWAQQPGLNGTRESVSAATPVQVPAGRLVRPGIETDEGGLWAMMDREETRLRRSSFVVRDAVLSAYVQQLACRLAGDHCADVRVHVVRSPVFNANMAPNGMMQVWTGLLLRVENEAQLAAVLGHEIGHYLERHTLQLMRDAKGKAAFAQFAAMFGLVGAVAGVAASASFFSFNRDQESRADRLGMLLMQRAGYDGREAARVWDNLLGELKVRGGDEAGRRSPMMATHPPAENRRDELLRLAGDGGGRVAADDFGLAIAAHRLGWMQDEIRRGQFEESLVLFDRMLARNPDDAQVLFARGEVLRQRDGPGDHERCVADLRAASASGRPPVDAYRSLGLALKGRSERAGAASAFERYLAAAPDAVDASLIKSYLSELQR